MTPNVIPQVVDFEGYLDEILNDLVDNISDVTSVTDRPVAVIFCSDEVDPGFITRLMRPGFQVRVNGASSAQTNKRLDRAMHLLASLANPDGWSAFAEARGMDEGKGAPFKRDHLSRELYEEVARRRRIAPINAALRVLDHNSFRGRDGYGLRRVHARWQAVRDRVINDNKSCRLATTIFAGHKW